MTEAALNGCLAGSSELQLIFAHWRFVQAKLKILSLQWQRKWLKASAWHLQPNVPSVFCVSRVQPVICQVLFYILHKESASPRLLHGCSHWRWVGGDENGGSSRWAALAFNLLLEGGNDSLDRVSCVHVVIHMCVAPSSWNICWRVSIDSSIGGIAAVSCPLASSWQTRRGCMPIADGADLNWWPHPSCCIFVLGSLREST